jgi:DNA-binding PadR family transcriptional regulator
MTRRPSPQTAAVLRTLAARGDEWSHGYELCRAVALQAGTLYPILIRLAERGQVETSWESDPPRGRPARHLYRLSAAGAELARQTDQQVPKTQPRVRPVGSRTPRPA